VRRYVEQEFSVQKMVAKYIDLYRHLLEEVQHRAA